MARFLAAALALSLVFGMLFGSAQTAEAAEKPVLISNEAYPDFLTLRNGQNAPLIDGALVQVGDSGEGWSYAEKDLLKLTGGASIRSILINDSLDENRDPTTQRGTRKFTIEVTGTNTIYGSTKGQKHIWLELSGGSVDAFGFFQGTVTMFGYDYGINVLGSVTFAGTGTLVLENDAENPLPVFVNAMGDVTIDGPAIKADMQSLKHYYQAISAYAYDGDEPAGTIQIKKGSLEVKNVGSSFPALRAGKGMKLAKGVTIKAGTSASKAKAVTCQKFWNGPDGPSSKNYKYMLIQSEKKVTAPGKVTISGIESAKTGEMTVTLKALEDVDGYEITYATSSKFTGAKTKSVTGSKATIQSLKAGKKYYVKARAYRLDGRGKKVYGAYGAVKTVTISD